MTISDDTGTNRFALKKVVSKGYNIALFIWIILLHNSLLLLALLPL